MKLRVATYLSDGIPNMGCKSHGKVFTYVFPSFRWKSYLGHATVQIMRNYLSHEEIHLLLERMGMHKASRALDNFCVACFLKKKETDSQVRRREIAEPTGIEGMILAVERRAKTMENDNKAYIPHTP